MLPRRSIVRSVLHDPPRLRCEKARSAQWVYRNTGNQISQEKNHNSRFDPIISTIIPNNIFLSTPPHCLTMQSTNMSPPSHSLQRKLNSFPWIALWLGRKNF